MEAMDKWRKYINNSGVDIWTHIEQSIILAHTDHFDQLRLRRDRFAELMFGPRQPKGSPEKTLNRTEDNEDGGLQPVKDEDEVEVDVDEEEEEEEDDDREAVRGAEEGNEEVRIDTDDEQEEGQFDEPASGAEDDAPPLEEFDEDVEALQDDMEKEMLLKNEILSIRSTIESMPNEFLLPEDEAIDILCRVEELNISVDALKVLEETKIGKSISKYRKHESEAVRNKAKEIVRHWKALVRDYFALRTEEEEHNAASANVATDDAVLADGVGLNIPPLDEAGLAAARAVGFSDVLNFSESDLSAATASASSGACGPSPASTINAPTSSSSPDQDQGVRRSNGGARVLKVDKHRPVHMEAKPHQNQSQMQRKPVASSGDIRKVVPKVPSGVARPSSGIKPSMDSRTPASALPPPARQKNENGIIRRPEPRQIPSVGAIRPREKETTKPGLATKPVSLPSNDVNARIEASKRKLHENYEAINSAKKQRTIRTLDLTDLPSGGPRAQKPGQRAGWVKTK